MVLPTDNSSVDMEADKVTTKSSVNKKVADILNVIQNDASKQPPPAQPTKKQNLKKNAMPRGLPKSGRPWKEPKEKYVYI